MPQSSVSTVFLNGKYLPDTQALISPEDRGFYFADGVYEVVKYYKGKPFCFDEHVARLKKSLAGIRIDFYASGELRVICDRIIESNHLVGEYSGVYMQITRGVAPRIHRFPGRDVSPTLYVRGFQMPTFLPDLRNGIQVITREDIRWLRCNIKSIALLPNTILFQEATEQNAGECFLIRNGNYTEATHSNIMAVIRGTVLTHPDSNLILPGITKNVVIRICREQGIPIEERPVREEETHLFDECFITGTGSEVMPVIGINGKPVGQGRPGPITRRLQKELFRITYEELGGEVIGDW